MVAAQLSPVAVVGAAGREVVPCKVGLMAFPTVASWNHVYDGGKEPVLRVRAFLTSVVFCVNGLPITLKACCARGGKRSCALSEERSR